MVGTYGGTTATAPRRTQGGYSTHVVVDEDFVLRIPDGSTLDAAAPLLCAGITTYSPLRHWGAGPGKKVAVVGSAAWATWPSRSRTRWAPRSPSCRSR
jgi:uncharacterized zinc-type alcohol dehydrogenase-like protein